MFWFKIGKSCVGVMVYLMSYFGLDLFCMIFKKSNKITLQGTLSRLKTHKQYRIAFNKLNINNENGITYQRGNFSSWYQVFVQEQNLTDFVK